MTSWNQRWLSAGHYVIHKYGRPQTRLALYKGSRPCKRCGTRRRLRNGNWEYWNKITRRWTSENPVCVKKPGR